MCVVARLIADSFLDKWESANNFLPKGQPITNPKKPSILYKYFQYLANKLPYLHKLVTRSRCHAFAMVIVGDILDNIFVVGGDTFCVEHFCFVTRTKTLKLQKSGNDLRPIKLNATHIRKPRCKNKMVTLLPILHMH